MPVAGRGTTSMRLLGAAIDTFYDVTPSFPPTPPRAPVSPFQDASGAADALSPPAHPESAELGYLKLEGWEVDDMFTIQRPVSFLVKNLPVMLGRRGAAVGPDDTPKLQVTTSTKVSREHALLDWSEDQSSFTLSVVGKNTIIVDSA